MKVKVEIISRETIKPSSPTPHHLQTYQLSFLDQISPPVFMPILLFFETDHDAATAKLNNADKSDRLKTSLSKALTLFYPLAGRLVDNVSVDCNDEGVSYLEARANCKLSDVVKEPVPGEYNKFLPCELDYVDDMLLSIQVTTFNCGGMAVGTCLSHKVADALSLILFITSWAATAREDSDLVCPQFDSAKLFPPKDISGYKPTVGITKEVIVTKRFVFSNSVVAALRDKYTDSTNVDSPIRPTRVETLSVFIWNRFVDATKLESGPERHHIVVHAVNLRPKIEPPLPEHSFGNLSRIAMARPSIDSGEESRGLLRQMRETIKSVDREFVTNLREGSEHLNNITELRHRFMKGQVTSFNFTSLCRLPMYEVDFGWGRPERVGSARLPFKNLVIFMDTGSGDGIEAWINLAEEDMVKFEADEELLALLHQPLNNLRYS